MRILKRAGVIAWLMGIAAVIGLTIWSGVDSVGHALASVGAGMVLVVLVRFATIAVAGIGWWLLFSPVKRDRKSVV